ncbi:MAG: SAM-dependent methyltransferase, partial [Gammaproteobacteria bacterium]
DAAQRLDCARACVDRLKPGGLIILDNSDWFVATARYLREQGFLQVDMHGFGPINNYTWCTSLFFSRDFAWTPRHPQQPAHGIGALPQYAAEEDGLR